MMFEQCSLRTRHRDERKFFVSQDSMVGHLSGGQSIDSDQISVIADPDQHSAVSASSSGGFVSSETVSSL